MSLVSTGWLSPRLNTAILEHGEFFIDWYPWLSLSVFLQSTVEPETKDLLSEASWLEILSGENGGFRT